jgi:hypothetical protein
VAANERAWAKKVTRTVVGNPLRDTHLFPTCLFDLVTYHEIDERRWNFEDGAYYYNCVWTLLVEIDNPGFAMRPTVHCKSLNIKYKKGLRERRDCCCSWY